MNWAICELASTGKTRLVNIDQVMYADERGNSTVLTMVNGESFPIVGPIAQWESGLRILTTIRGD